MWGAAGQEVTAIGTRAKSFNFYELFVNFLTTSLIDKLPYSINN